MSRLKYRFKYHHYGREKLAIRPVNWTDGLWRLWLAGSGIYFVLTACQIFFHHAHETSMGHKLADLAATGILPCAAFLFVAKTLHWIWTGFVSPPRAKGSRLPDVSHRRYSANLTGCAGDSYHQPASAR